MTGNTSKKVKRSSKKSLNKPSHRVIGHVKHAVVPHKKNQYQPHLIRRWGLVAVLSMVIALQFAADLPIFNEPSDDVVLGTEASLSQRELFDESNTVRQSNDVPLLELDARLNEAATMKARDMIDRDYWSHTAPDGTTPWYWYRKVDYRYDFAGENLAKGFQTPGAAVTAWMDSEEHRKNALSPNYEDVGFGIAEGEIDGEQARVVVALYGSPVGRPVQSEGQVLAAENGRISPLTRFGVALQSLDPARLGGLAILGIMLIIALAAHTCRHKLPKSVRSGWKRHHGMYKALVIVGVAIILIALYGQGQIL